MALSDGLNALPVCLPNPPVGCVIVVDDEVVARGHTQAPGEFHAEAMALSAATVELSDATIYVTLEPCSFHGRTPSCARALASCRAKRVVVAMLDPDRRNSGAGVEILRESGVNVEVGLLEACARNALGRYLVDC